MKFKAKIQRFGEGTHFVNIPKSVIDTMGLEKGQELLFSLYPTKVFSYRCKRCQHQFDSNDEIPYCPIDQCEDLEVLEND